MSTGSLNNAAPTCLQKISFIPRYHQWAGWLFLSHPHQSKKHKAVCFSIEGCGAQKFNVL